jgi:uncharacterized protein (DUF1501 family)
MHPLVRRSLADTIGNRYLVVLFLDGGNDGLNTVTPINDGGGSLRADYDLVRSNINLPDDSLLPIDPDPLSGADLGLHPGFTALHDLYVNKSSVAVIQGCGYPDYNLSHDESRHFWQTGNPLGVGSLAGTGWVGRHLAGAGGYGGNDVPGVAIDFTVPLELRQTATSVLAIPRVEDFGFPYDYYDGGGDIAAKRAAFNALYQEAAPSAQEQFGFIGTSGAATLLSSEAYPALHDLYIDDRGVWNAAYGAVNRSVARDLREVAKIIYGVEQGVPNVEARFFRVANGGYDTHSNQGGAETNGAHYMLHKEVGDSLKVFYDDLEDMGAVDKVCVLVYSEFSRRIPQNSNGTDHGSQGPMFLIGGKVKGGVYGNHPNINPSALDGQENTPYSQAAADPFRSTDFRDVYGTVLKHWVNMDHNDVLSMMPLDTETPADEYWTEEDFDLDLFNP